MAVEGLEGYRTLYVKVGGAFPEGMAQNLACAEHYHVVNEGVATERAASVA